MTADQKAVIRLRDARNEYFILEQQFQYVVNHDSMDEVILQMAAKEKELDAIRLQLMEVPTNADFSAFRRSYPISQVFG